MGILNEVKRLPLMPGVYLFKDGRGTILYAGKATKLRSRVLSYFRNGARLGPWKEQLVREVKKIDFEETKTAIAALLREAEYIKKYQPKYNVVLKDDKDYVYIGITQEQPPRIFTTHQREKSAEYFGPFTDALAAREVVRVAQKIFVLHRLRAASLDEYHEAVQEIRLFLRGETKKLYKKIKMAMESATKQKDFERAAVLRDRLFRFQKIWQTEKQRDLLKAEPEERGSRAVEELNVILAQAGIHTKRLRNSPQPPLTLRGGEHEGRFFRIEGYDLSNVQGKFAVGSMVVFLDGRPAKSEYRKFKIKTVRGANDVAMMYEILRRRFWHLKDWDVPDLIVLDGGKGQMTFGLKAQKDADVDLPMIGLAKREEQIVLPNGKLLKLPRNSAALQLLQAVRDEAHRFAREYYRVLHRRTMTHNT